MRTPRAWVLSKALSRRAGLRVASAALLITIAACVVAKAAQAPNDQASGSLEVSQALAQGDQFLSVKEYEKALAAYQHADKLSHHTCAVCYLRIVSILRKAGDFDDALDMAKKAVAAAGDNKVVAAQAHLVRGSLFVSMANKPSDKKLREAEDEFRQALALQPTLALAHRNLGIALIKQNRDADGIAELNLFVAAPGNSEKNIAEARGFIAEAENPANRKGVARVRLDMPSLDGYRGVRFVDTPGLESAFGNSERPEAGIRTTLPNTLAWAGPTLAT